MNTFQDRETERRNSNSLPTGPTTRGQSGANRVWLVDDDEIVRSLLARMLGKVSGIECPREFSSPDALLAALERETPPDTILLDVHLGDQNGIDFIQPIKSRATATRVLMLTTFHDSGHKRRALQAGASGFLVKRATLAEIAEHILPPQTHPETGFGGEE